jgi:hypothetical protein
MWGREKREVLCCTPFILKIIPHAAILMPKMDLVKARHPNRRGQSDPTLFLYEATDTTGMRREQLAPWKRSVSKRAGEEEMGIDNLEDASGCIHPEGACRMLSYLTLTE